MSGEINQTLDTTLAPTAEYLLEQPMPTPTDRAISVHAKTTNITIFLPKLAGDPYEKLIANTEIYINGQRVGERYVMHGTLTSYPGVWVFSVDGKFAGLYLVELHLKDSIFSAPFYVHQWAVEVE